MMNQEVVPIDGVISTYPIVIPLQSRFTESGPGRSRTFLLEEFHLFVPRVLLPNICQYGPYKITVEEIVSGTNITGVTHNTCIREELENKDLAGDGTISTIFAFNTGDAYPKEPFEIRCGQDLTQLTFHLWYLTNDGRNYAEITPSAINVVDVIPRAYGYLKAKFYNN